jgi:hypothetical protein
MTPIRSPGVLPNRHSALHLKFGSICVQRIILFSTGLSRRSGRIWAGAAWPGERTGKAWLAHSPPAKPQD